MLLCTRPPLLLPGSIGLLAWPLLLRRGKPWWLLLKLHDDLNMPLAWAWAWLETGLGDECWAWLETGLGDECRANGLSGWGPPPPGFALFDSGKREASRSAASFRLRS